MTKQTSLRVEATALLIGLSMLLAGCFISPGKFSSELVLEPNENFSFSYEGEIFFLGLSRLAEEGAAAEEFKPSECYDEETYEERECTEAELTQQRQDWDAGAEMRAAKAKQEAEQMSAMMGGIDPSDPEASAELVRLLLRQQGWERVEDKGDGVFDVSYRVEGKLTHDFMFPVIEGFPLTNPFVQIHIRNGNVVRINAPGYASENETNPMGSMMGSMVGLGSIAAMSDNAPDAEMPNFPTIEGTFSILTKGGMQIRANNTDEGANPTPDGEVLTWNISPRTTAAPTALIALNP